MPLKRWLPFLPPEAATAVLNRGLRKAMTIKTTSSRKHHLTVVPRFKVRAHRDTYDGQIKIWPPINRAGWVPFKKWLKKAHDSQDALLAGERAQEREGVLYQRAKMLRRESTK